MPRIRQQRRDTLPMEEIQREINSFEVPVSFEVPPEKRDLSFIRRYGVSVRKMDNESQRVTYKLWYCLCSRTCIRRKVHIRMYRNDTSAARKHLRLIHDIEGRIYLLSYIYNLIEYN